MKKIIANRIKELRKENHITQIALAKRCGVCRETIVYVEQNKYTPAYTLALDIADALGVPASDVFIVSSDRAAAKKI